MFPLLAHPARQLKGEIRCAIILQVAALLFLSGSNMAHAGAWVQPKGKGQIITSLAYYRSDTYVDQSGNTFDQNAFSKTELNPYGEYGLTDETTLGFNAFLQYFAQSPEDMLPTVPTLRMGDTYGLELELFTRHQLWKRENTVLSLQPLIKLPTLYVGKSDTSTQATPFDAQLGVAGGYSRDFFGHDSFAELGIAYRHRFGEPSDQIRVNAKFGMQLNEDWLALLEAGGIFSLGESSTLAFTALGEDDIDLGKISASLVYDLTENVALSGGGFYHPYARNTGRGGGAILAVWWTF